MANDPTPAASWTSLGSTTNTKYYLAATDILVAVPEPGLVEDAASARMNLRFQASWANSVGRPCAVVVHLGSLVGQDGEARRTYAEGMDPSRFFAACLVVTSPLSRAIGSFFLGLSKPRVPARLFESFDAAIAWAESQRPAGRGP